MEQHSMLFVIVKQHILLGLKKVGTIYFTNFELILHQ